jgi:prefoldin subunit 5
MKGWLFWRWNPKWKKPEVTVIEVDPDDEEITDAHIILSEEVEQLQAEIQRLNRLVEMIENENDQLRRIFRRGESKE